MERFGVRERRASVGLAVRDECRYIDGAKYRAEVGLGRCGPPLERLPGARPVLRHRQIAAQRVPRLHVKGLGSESGWENDQAGDTAASLRPSCRRLTFGCWDGETAPWQAARWCACPDTPSQSRSGEPASLGQVRRAASVPSGSRSTRVANGRLIWSRIVCSRVESAREAWWSRILRACRATMRRLARVPVS